jgi:hypothetical protein
MVQALAASAALSYMFPHASFGSHDSQGRALTLLPEGEQLPCALVFSRADLSEEISND